MSQHRSRLSLLLLCLLFICLTACDSPFASASSGTQNNSHAGDETPLVRDPSPTSQPTPAVQTDCPSEGKARVAVMPPLHLGNRQEIVYYHNIDNQMVLNIFDVQRKAASPIIGENEQIQSAQVSADGQWVLMVATVNSYSELQLVRIDGKFFQTLYCAPAGQQIGASAQWSPGQKQIIFAQGSGSSFSSLYILSPTGQAVSEELSGPAGSSIAPATWLDNTRVYVRVANSLYLLNTGKGPNQQISDMQLIRGIGDALWDFDTSADARTLYMSISLPAQGSAVGQSEIDADSINGAFGKQILLSHTLSIVGLRVINSSSLMLVSYTQSSGAQAQTNELGWWKVNTDGTGLVQLNHYPHAGGAGPGAWGPFNPYTQYLWSNFSRDGSLYADGLFYGSLNGGALIRYAADGEGDGNVLVGWATI